MSVTTAKKINPEDYILSVLSPEERLDAAFKVAREVKKTKLRMKDIIKKIDTLNKNIKHYQQSSKRYPQWNENINK
jgi:hypothetical protein